MVSYSPQKSLTILILATLIFWSGLGFLVYYFIAWDIRNLNQEIQEKKLELAQLEYNAQHFDSFAASYQEAEKDKQLLSEVILEESKVINFIQKLEGIAEASGVTQTIDLKITEEPKKKEKSKEGEGEDSEKEKETEKPFNTLVYRLSLRGDFPSIVKYIQGLENLNNYTNINALNLNLSRQKEEDRLDLVAANIEAEVYLKK